MLLNLVKMKDEEIKQLKYQIGNELELSQSINSHMRTSTTPLRASANAKSQELQEPLAESPETNQLEGSQKMRKIPGEGTPLID